MLGTPNNGSHLMVHSLLGKSDSMRKLAMLSLDQDLQQVLEIVAGFNGALELLPRPGFRDSGAGQNDGVDTEAYYQRNEWSTLGQANQDRWFGDHHCGVTDGTPLMAARNAWEELPVEVPNPDRVAYVFGQADQTPCGLGLRDGRLRLLFTPDGDGSVTWASGRIESLMANNRCWYIPVEHADLTGKPDYFDAIRDLVENGTTTRLEHPPVRRGGEAPVFSREAGPVAYPSEEELARAFLGGQPRRPARRSNRRKLEVSVRAGDLRFANLPVLCGHYHGDVISGPEAVLDRMVDGQLSQRQRLGVYADLVGSSAIVLMPRSPEESRRGTQRGAVVVGLGELNGRLTTLDVTETVRAGILRLLLRAKDNPAETMGQGVAITSLLIGQNSTTHISIGESLAAIVRGICEANGKFDGSNDPYVGKVEFLELYLDSAITAAHEIQDLPNDLADELRRWNVQLVPTPELIMADGARHRLQAGGAGGYWPRLAVTDADADPDAASCPPECYQSHWKSPIPDGALRELLATHCRPSEAPTAQAAPAAPPAVARRYPDRLRYLFVSERARTESVAQQRQPGLVEAIVGLQIHRNSYDAKLSCLLFELMVPLDYKATARELDRLVLQVDGYTANLPWELLQTDDQPMVLETAMVRQFATSRFRRQVNNCSDRTACVIAAPSTEGFAEHFGRPKDEVLPRLTGAIEEGEAIKAMLDEAKYECAYSREAEAIDVLSTLMCRPYRLLAISGHGIFEARHVDGQLRTGVVLSGGLLITAAEIGQMQAVPEVVFLNCCHLGEVNTGAPLNKLAYSLARELIEIGVRCVVAAGWAVDDDAATTFAKTFFEQLLADNASFGNAIHQARKQVYRRHGGCNTWGAYQAYGNPGYRLDPDDREQQKPPSRMVAVAELLDQLGRRLLDAKTPGYERIEVSKLAGEMATLFNQSPPDWQERPEVLEALGKVYAELARDGFDQARACYLQAIAREDKRGVVAIKTIEQLANLEARTGENQGGQAGKTLVQTAIERLMALRTGTTGADAGINAERAALLGSAYKRLAAVMAKNRSAWRTVAKVLKQSADAYREALGDDPAATPYNALNHLQSAWLADDLEAGSADQEIALARRCADTARQRFSQSQDFFDAVMSADAEVTAWLLGGAVSEGDAGRLRQEYGDTLKGVQASARQRDSVAAQLGLLARFLKLRGRGPDEPMARVLDELATMFGAPAATASTMPAPESVPARSGGRPARSPAPAKPAKRQTGKGGKNP